MIAMLTVSYHLSLGFVYVKVFFAEQFITPWSLVTSHIESSQNVGFKILEGLSLTCIQYKHASRVMWWWLQGYVIVMRDSSIDCFWDGFLEAPQRVSQGLLSEGNYLLELGVMPMQFRPAPCWIAYPKAPCTCFQGEWSIWIEGIEAMLWSLLAHPWRVCACR